MAKEGVPIPLERESKDPDRAFMPALHHKGYLLDFTQDADNPSIMHVQSDTTTAGKVVPLMNMYEESTLFKLFEAVYDGYPESLEQYLRLIPLEEIHPQDNPIARLISSIATILPKKPRKTTSLYQTCSRYTT